MPSTVSTRKGGLAVRFSVAETIVGAGAFGTDQRARHVEAVLRQQFIEVIAGDAARNARKFLAHQIGIAVAEARETRIDLAHAAAAANERVELLGAGAAHGHARAVVEHDVERLDVVDGLAAQQPVHAATVVADHAAQRAARVSGRVGRIGKVMKLGGVAQPVKHDAGLDRARAWLRDRSTLSRVHVARKVEDDGHVGALAGEAGAGAARQHRGACRAAGGQGGFNIGGIARQHDADGELAIIRGVRRIEGARAEIEADFAAHLRLEPHLELAMRRKPLMIQCRTIGEDEKCAHV